MAEKDHVDIIVKQWKSERPDLDVSPMEVIGRISRLSRILEKDLKPIFSKYGLQSGEFDVLAALRRCGKPYQLKPTELFKSVMLTSGAMTNRLDRLESAGLITRKADPNDRRSSLVSLAAKGLKLIDRAVADHYANEQQLLGTLNKSERKTLTHLLRKLLLDFEGAQS